ncbi:MAG: Snf7 family protein [Candidatus Bathyarchaeota archaeon]|nr:Snf7 family protein [Candidatus Termiticorpusculum sp.]MCL2868164.1 Snf7 family protein [Candidatus Termiticorpusculum sp.]
MSENFTKKWEQKKDENSLLNSLNQTIKPQQPLKPRLDIATRKLDAQIQRLDQTSDRFTQKDKTLFTKLVDSYQQHDMAHANIYATELAEIRKMSKIIMNARLALDQINLRIKTVTELGDVVSMLGPCIGVLRSVNSGMGGILPAAENELSEIGDMLSGVMLEAGQGSGMSLNFNSVSEDATKILSEAAIVAEQKINANFPDLPPGMPTGSTTDKTQT